MIPLKLKYECLSVLGQNLKLIHFYKKMFDYLTVFNVNNLPVKMLSHFFLLFSNIEKRFVILSFIDFRLAI